MATSAKHPERRVRQIMKTLAMDRAASANAAAIGNAPVDEAVAQALGANAVLDAGHLDRCRNS